MKCLVTGAAGFIGSHLSEKLIKDGHSVTGIDCFTDYYAKRKKVSNLATLRKTTEFEFIEADLSTANLGPILRGVEYVFHLAGQPGVRASWGKTFSYYVKDNIVATQRLLEAARKRQTEKFIYASSSSIYGDSESLPTPEAAVPKPVSPYGATKLVGEHLCHVYFRNYSLPAVVLRYFTVFGPRQRPDMAFNIFIREISRRAKIQIYGDGEQRHDFTFVDDIVAGTILATKASPGSTYNIGAGRSTSLNEAIAMIESIIEKDANIERMETAAGDVRNTTADIQRARADLGYRPRTSLADGLTAQIAFQVGHR